MSNHSVIEHRANYHHIRIEEDFVSICREGEASPHCKALILSILEHWTNTKRDKGEEPIIYMTYQLWAENMYCLFGRNTIILSLKELEADQLLKRHPHITPKNKDTFAYTLVIDVLQKKLKGLADKAPNDTRPNPNAFKNKRVLKQTHLKKDDERVLKQTHDAFKKGHNVSSITQLQTITSDTISSDIVAVDVAGTTDPLVSLSDQALIDEITRREKERLTNTPLIANKPTQKDSSKPSKAQVKATKARKTEPLISPQARLVWEIWLEMPWNKDISPTLTETAAKHCESLSKVEISKDIIFKVLNFAKKNDRNGFYEGKSKELGHVVSEYSRWKSSQYQVQVEEVKKEVVTVGSRASVPFSKQARL